MDEITDPKLLDDILRYLQSRKAGDNHPSISARTINELAFGGRIDPQELEHHLQVLAEKELIRASVMKDGTDARLVGKGELFIKKGGFTKSAIEAKEKQLKQEKLLELQIADLENRIATQGEQLDFWIETAKANKRKARYIRPAFWVSVLSLIVAIGSLILSKGCG